MKNLRLDIEQAQCDGQLIIWQIPLRLEHQKVGLSSMQVIFTDKWNEHMLTSDNPIRMIPVQCSLLKENMWNPRGVFFNIDLFQKFTQTYTYRQNEIGKYLFSNEIQKINLFKNIMILCHLL
jgi:hypothetical protein